MGSIAATLRKCDFDDIIEELQCKRFIPDNVIVLLRYWYIMYNSEITKSKSSQISFPTSMPDSKSIS